MSVDGMGHDFPSELYSSVADAIDRTARLKGWTRLTRAGKLKYVQRVLTTLQQARDSGKASANGFHG